MKNPNEQKADANRAAIYARVSDRSQAEEDKTSLSEQTIEMEAYCERKGLTIVARYQEVGRGWTKKRPEFQRMLADARQGRFDTIICWKSDRLSRGLYPAAALMEVVEAYQIRIESVMDAIDMKTFGIMAAIGKIELDNLRERSSMGKRGAAKLGRIPNAGVPFGYQIGEGGKPEVLDAEAQIVQRIFRQYVYEGLGAPTIARQLTDEGVPTRQFGKRWHMSYVHRVLGNTAYKGTWMYGQKRKIATEDGTRVYEQPQEMWIAIPFPPLVDDATWALAQKAKRQRLDKSKRNTKEFYLLQKLLRCAECGRMFGAKTNWYSTSRRNGKSYRYLSPSPRRYYHCYGVNERLHCREHSFLRAEKLEELVWDEVRQILEDPTAIVDVIESSEAQRGRGDAQETAKLERDLRKVQVEEDRAIRLFVSGKITEPQLDLQRKFITERLENLRSRLEESQTREASRARKQFLKETVLEWAGKVGAGLDEMSPEQRRETLGMVVDEILIDRGNKVSITLGIPVDESVAIASNPS